MIFENTPRRTRTRISILLLLMLLPAAACESSGPTATGQPGPVINFQEALTLRLGLRERGIQLRFRETVEEPILPTITDRYTYDGQDVRLYGFASTEDAEAALATVSEDGRTVGGEELPWSGTPHFYHTRRLVVLHVGTSGELELALSEILGGQVAGG